MTSFKSYHVLHRQKSVSGLGRGRGVHLFESRSRMRISGGDHTLRRWGGTLALSSSGKWHRSSGSNRRFWPTLMSFEACAKNIREIKLAFSQKIGGGTSATNSSAAAPSAEATLSPIFFELFANTSGAMLCFDDDDTRCATEVSKSAAGGSLDDMAVHRSQHNARLLSGVVGVRHRYHHGTFSHHDRTTWPYSPNSRLSSLDSRVSTVSL